MENEPLQDFFAQNRVAVRKNGWRNGADTLSKGLLGDLLGPAHLRRLKLFGFAMC